MPTFEKYFQQELYAAKRLAQSFAKAHPNVAPLLRDKSTDPDVERLLEGVAFLSAQIKERINDQLPEFMGDMIEKFFPHYLRPMPAATIMVFDPNQTVAKTTLLKAGTVVNSVPIDGVQYPFRTTYDIDVHPMEIESATLVRRSTDLSFIQLDFKLKGTTFKAWTPPERLSLHMSGRFPQAANLHCYLLSLVEYVELEINGKAHLRLDVDSLIAGGFRDEESILPYPGHAYPAYRLLQELIYWA
jgi:type VI secretion system protein ImpG